MDKDYWNQTDVMLISKTNLVFSGACDIAGTFEDITFLVICQPPSCFATKPTSSCDFSVSYIFPWWLFLFPSEIFPSQCHQMDPLVSGEKKKLFFIPHFVNTQAMFSDLWRPQEQESPALNTLNGNSPFCLTCLSQQCGHSPGKCI